jgi:cell division protein FtsB
MIWFYTFLFSLVIIGVLIYKNSHHYAKYLEYKEHSEDLEKTNKKLETRNAQYKAILRQMKEDIESVERL